MKRGIYTFTPNPVLDLGGTVEKVLPDEKVYVQNETRSPGGNGINAGRIIHRLRGPVTLSGFLGGGIGTEIESLLSLEKLSHKFVKVQNDSRIGITVSSLNSHTQTRLSFPGPRISPTEKRTMFNWLQALPLESMLIIGGSLPPGLGLSDLKKLLKIGHSKNMGMIVDGPSDVLKGILKSRPLMIKPNLLEFQELTGTKVRSIKEVLKEAQALTKWVPLVCVSSVEDGALLVSEKCAWFGRIPKVKVNSVVGAGDSMVGAMALHLWKGFRPGRKNSWQQLSEEHLGETLRWGLAASCASLSHRGTNLGTAAEIQKFYAQTTVNKIGAAHVG